MTQQFIRSQKTGLLVSPEQALAEEREMRKRQLLTLKIIKVVGYLVSWAIFIALLNWLVPMGK